MASSDNFVSMEPSWMFRPTFADSWLSEAFARDTETLTRALQNSLSNHSDNPSSEMFHQPETPTTVSGGSENETAVSKRRSGVGVSGGKVSKRKSRASKRATTTFITADPANFRQMVQQVTGARFGGNVQMPIPIPIPTVLKPEPQRPASRIPTGCLPTLDTSAFFLNQPSDFSVQQQGAVPDGSNGFQFESFGSFPTLESWK